MSRDVSVLVCGVGEEASATAHALFAEGYVVALYRAMAPRMLRRRMSFADVWYDGYAQLDGVEARRADVNAEFVLALQTRSFIPLLRGRLSEALERWPWHVVVAAEEEKEAVTTGLRELGGLTIGLGPSFAPGVDCDLTIETQGPDPGAILHPGDAPYQFRKPRVTDETDSVLVHAPAAGLFRAHIPIGASVEPGGALGFLEDVCIAAPTGGRILGIARREQAVAQGDAIAEITPTTSAPVAGVSPRNKLVAHGVAFAIELENEGLKPFSFEDWGR